MCHLKAPTVVKPRHDPEAPESLVMPRPGLSHQVYIIHQSLKKNCIIHALNTCIIHALCIELLIFLFCVSLYAFN